MYYIKKKVVSPKSKFILSKKIHIREMRHLALWRFETQAGRSIFRYAILNDGCMGEILTLPYSNNLNLTSGPQLAANQYEFNRDLILKTILDQDYTNGIITPYQPPISHEYITYVPFHSVDSFVRNFLEVQVDPQFLVDPSVFSADQSTFSPDPDLGLDHDSFSNFFETGVNNFFLSEASMIIWKKAFGVSVMAIIYKSSGFLMGNIGLEELSMIKSFMDMFNDSISSRTP